MNDRDRVIQLQKIEMELGLVAKEIAQRKLELKDAHERFDGLIIDMRELVRKDTNQENLFDRETGELKDTHITIEAKGENIMNGTVLDLKQATKDLVRHYTHAKGGDNAS